MRFEFDLDVPPKWLAPGEDLNASARIWVAERLANRYMEAVKEDATKDLNRVLSPIGGGPDGSISRVPEAPGVSGHK